MCCEKSCSGKFIAVLGRPKYWSPTMGLRGRNTSFVTKAWWGLLIILHLLAGHQNDQTLADGRNLNLKQTPEIVLHDLNAVQEDSPSDCEISCKKKNLVTSSSCVLICIHRQVLSGSTQGAQPLYRLANPESLRHSLGKANLSSSLVGSDHAGEYPCCNGSGRCWNQVMVLGTVVVRPWEKSSHGDQTHQGCQSSVRLNDSKFCDLAVPAIPDGLLVEKPFDLEIPPASSDYVSDEDRGGRTHGLSGKPSPRSSSALDQRKRSVDGGVPVHFHCTSDGECCGGSDYCLEQSQCIPASHVETSSDREFPQGSDHCLTERESCYDWSGHICRKESSPSLYSNHCIPSAITSHKENGKLNLRSLERSLFVSPVVREHGIPPAVPSPGEPRSPVQTSSYQADKSVVHEITNGPSNSSGLEPEDRP